MALFLPICPIACAARPAETPVNGSAHRPSASVDFRENPTNQAIPPAELTPLIAIEDASFDPGAGRVFITLSQDPVSNRDVRLRLTYPDGEIDTMVRLAKSVQIVSLPTRRRPDFVKLEPDVQRPGRAMQRSEPSVDSPDRRLDREDPREISVGVFPIVSSSVTAARALDEVAGD